MTAERIIATAERLNSLTAQREPHDHRPSKAPGPTAAADRPCTSDCRPTLSHAEPCPECGSRQRSRVGGSGLAASSVECHECGSRASS